MGGGIRVADPGGDGDPKLLGGGRSDQPPRPLDRHERLLARRLRHHPRELVAADATQDILGARVVSQAPRNADQHLVADLVPAEVVDVLEVVDVDHCH